DKPFVWRYRDYVVRSFNADKPFDQFTREQIAGDELPFTPDRLIATGYYRLGIWDDEPVDHKQALYDDLDDIVATTSQVFLGLTVNCARCHEHKIDPITHADYYRMLSFFSGLNRFGVRSPDSVANFSLRGLAPPEERLKNKDEVKKYSDAKRNLENKTRQFEKRLRADLIPVEKEDFQYRMNRIPLAKKRIGKIFKQREFDRYAEAIKQLNELENNRPTSLTQALVVTEIGPKARDFSVLARGNAHAETEPVQPGFLTVLTNVTGGDGDAGDPDEQLPPPDAEFSQQPDNPHSSGRRTALAKWLTDSNAQPMTARVLANRLWQYHFGRGLVRSSNDFGFQGRPPTHPKLLDHLASRLIESGWHLKLMR
ncbi:MAG: DUF1549 domain-containing protein, partial [Planctomycetota bacterium]